MATTGRNTLKREFSKVDAAAAPSHGGDLEVNFVKKTCVAAGTGDRGSDSGALKCALADLG